MSTIINKPITFGQIAENSDFSILTSNDKFNQWFSRYAPEAERPKLGGMVKKSVIFVTGSSGAGKTTTMANIMSWTPNVSSIFYARECNLDEIKDQLNPFNISHSNALFADNTIFPKFKDFMDYLYESQPEMVMVDSLQAIASDEYRDFDMNKDDAADYIRQELTKYIKQRGGVLFLIGHNTKEGEFAGKNTNMQMVDAHMVLEYDKKNNVRKIYWGQKNRKGPMSSMYYEIQDGKIIYFTNEEYVHKIDKIKEEESEQVLLSNKQMSTKIMFKMFVEQFKGKEEYESFKSYSYDMLKQSLENNKRASFKLKESDVYFSVLNRIYDKAFNKNWL